MRKFAISPWALLLALALSACQSGVERVAPAIASSNPADGATAVATGSALEVVFSEAMDQASVQVGATPALDLGAGDWDDERTVTFVPAAGWLPGTHYVLEITGRDLAGNALAGVTRIAFDTASGADTAAPAVPANVVATAGEGEFSLVWDAGTEADLAGYTVFWGKSAAALESTLFVAAPGHAATVSGVENGVAYYYAVQAEDSSGNRSARSNTGTVTPQDATPPALVSSEPSDGATGLSEVPILRFTFSEPMDQGSLEIGICESADPPSEASCDSPSPAGFGAPVWSEGGTLARLNPGDAFEAGKTYVLALGARDRASNALPGPATIAFSLAATPDTTRPTVLAHEGNYQSDTPRAVISLVFSEAMDQQSVQDAFLSQPAISCSWAWRGNTADCTASGYLEQLTPYTIAIGTGAKDSAGNTLAAAYSFSFQTENFAPRLVQVSPRDGAFGVASDSPITFTFSEAMDADSLEDALQVSTGAGPVAGTQEWDASAPFQTVLIFRPLANYGDGTTVSWTVSEQAKEAPAGRTIGKGLAAPVSGSFVTRLVVGL